MSLQQRKAEIEAKLAELRKRKKISIEPIQQSKPPITINERKLNIPSVPSPLPSPSATATNVSLQICQVAKATISIPPQESITYSKAVQTNQNQQQLLIPIPIVDKIEQKQTHESITKLELELEMTNDERDQIIKSDQFQDFFTRISRVIECSLWDKTHTVDDGDNMKEIIKFRREFFDERWTRHRIVKSLDISTYHPELVLASYSSDDESNGVVLIWNTEYKSKPTPEYIFNCQSWVTSCKFSQFDPNIVLGGTYTGQIVAWDIRSNKRTPVRQTTLSISSHTHPISCLQVIGTENAHDLISISNEGKMCSWNIRTMKQSQESMNLIDNEDMIATTQLAFPGNDFNHFIIGSETGQIYSGFRHGTSSGIAKCYRGHSGPITGLSCHHSNKSLELSSLFLTSSFDCSVKLWSLKHLQPLYSFEVNNDYVTDVQWSPVHPSVFLTCDISGRFDIWNLNHDSELPLLSTILDGNVALTKCLWSSNGQQIILGDDQGKLYLYDVNEMLTQPKQNDFDKFNSTLHDMK